MYYVLLTNTVSGLFMATTSFGEDSIPQFEINNFTLGILEKLANINQEQNKHGEIITKDYIQKCSEYAAEGGT